jgi:hypothetical protein
MAEDAAESGGAKAPPLLFESFILLTEPDQDVVLRGGVS